MQKDSSTGFKESCHRAKTLKRHQRMRKKKRDDGLLVAVYIPPEQHIQSKAEKRLPFKAITVYFGIF
jgi:hypothetical protein